jgi:hypothetical protein
MVQANDPAFLPYTCSVCEDGCAFIVTRNALVAQVMRYVVYAWEWALLGVSVGFAIVCTVVLVASRKHNDVVHEGHKVLGLLAVGLVSYGTGMLMLAAAGREGVTGADIVTRSLGAGWCVRGVCVRARVCVCWQKAALLR